MGFRRRRGQPLDGDDGGGVKGPSSALTSFLREQGINAEQIRQRYEQSQALEAANDDTANNIPVNGSDDGNNNNDDNNNNINKNNDTHIALNFALDSDEEEITDQRVVENDSKRQKTDSPYTPTTGTNLFCSECDQNFTVTPYSKKIEKSGRVGYLCPSCSKIQIRRERLAKKHEIEARKRRKKIAAALLDKKQFKLPSLQDFCIHVITENIDHVNALGEIGNHNKMKICRILAKNRSLNNKTVELFLDNNTTELEFWDCSKIDKNKMNQVASFCPNLVSLTLNMCGQFHNDNLQYFSNKLSNLKELTLDGPFLINDDNWQSFFESNTAKNLTKFHLKNTHRFSNDSLVSLLENCGNNLESLSLSRLDGLNSKPVYDLLPHFLPNLKFLEISSPHNENLIDDDLLINLLSINCETLHTLILNKCSHLTNKFLVEGIKPFGANLTNLTLIDLDQIDDDGMNEVFTDWNINKGLTNINFERCISLTDASIYNVLNHSHQTLESLNLNSVKNISKVMFSKLSRNLTFPVLEYLDLGFVRSVDDSALAIISRICPVLKILEVYGDNRCTEKALVREDLTVIGRQTDSI